MTPKPKAVVLLSGGMDSCVTLAAAAKTHTVAVLHANYGQRTQVRELEAFIAIADHYSIEGLLRLTIDLRHIAAIGGSALTDVDISVPAADLTSTDVPITYVPFRNGNLLSAAVSWAEVLPAEAIFIGAVEEDSSGYPDCRRDFFDAYEEVISQGTRPGTNIKIETPLIHMTKAEIVLKGLEFGAPLELTWSCYSNGPTPCGDCDSCALRARGFRDAGVLDPLLNLSEGEPAPRST